MRSHSLNVIEVLLRAGAVVEGKVMDGTPLFKRVDKTCFSRARDDEIDTNYKADEPCHKFISEVLGAILSPRRSLGSCGRSRAKAEPPQLREAAARGAHVPPGLPDGARFLHGPGLSREQAGRKGRKGTGPEDGEGVQEIC